MNQLAVQIEGNIVRRKQALALTIVQRLADSTPVDTSMAISNWIVSLGGPSYAFNPAYVVGSQGSTQQASISATVAAAQAVLSGLRDRQDIYIQNNAPYIGKLNDGTGSRQAPAGFVQTAVLDGVASTAGVRIIR